MTLNADAESVDGYNIEKNGQDGQGIINFKTGAGSTIDGTLILETTIDGVTIAEITVGGEKVLFSPPNGDLQAGYYGTVASGDFISGDTLASDIGLTAGTAYNSTVDWLKFAWNAGTVMVPQKPFRYGLSWEDINAVDAVYGDANAPVVTINGNDYKVRNMRQADQDPVNDANNDPSILGPNNEWNKLMLPIHAKAPDSWGYPEYVDEPTEDWGINFTDQDLLTHYDYGNGGQQWGQETDSGNEFYRVYRGGNGVSYLRTYSSDNTGVSYGWRPLLEKL